MPSISVTVPAQPSLDQACGLRLDYPDTERLFDPKAFDMESHYELRERSSRFFAIVCSKTGTNFVTNPLTVQVDISVRTRAVKEMLGPELYSQLRKTDSGSRCLTVKCGELLKDMPPFLVVGGSQNRMKLMERSKSYMCTKTWGSCIGTLQNDSEVPTKIGISWLLPRERIPKHVLDRQCEGQDLILRPEDFVTLDDTIRAAKLTRSGTPSVDDNFFDRLLSERRGYGCLAENVRENRKVQCEQREWANERQIRVNHVYALCLQLDFPAKVSEPPSDDI